jgi:hypothetical protein
MWYFSKINEGATLIHVQTSVFERPKELALAGFAVCFFG